MSALNIQVRANAAPQTKAIERKPYRLEHVSTAKGVAYDFTWDGPRAYIAWHDIVLKDGEMHGDDLAPTRRQDMRDLLTFFPQGMRTQGWCDQADRQNAFTALYFDVDWVFDQLETPERERQLRPLIYFRDSTLLGLMHKLTALARQEQAPSRMLVDSVALTTAAELVSLHARRFSKGSLSANQLARAKEFIAAHLCDDVSLEQIAAAVGLSPFHFARAFKYATGQPPYRYLLERRIERAKHLMAATDLSLGEIATKAGFTSPSHFSRTFSEVEGETARAFRSRTH